MTNTKYKFLKKKKTKYIKHPLLTIIIYLILISIICSITFIYYFSNKLGSNLIKCAEDELNRLTSIIMSNCIEKYLQETKELNLVTITRNKNNDIERIQYNTKILNQTRARILEILDEDLDHLVKGELEETNINLNKLSDEYYERTSEGIIFNISTGSATGNTFFANLGPKIPINLSTVGDTSAKIITNITEYGLNNALLEISIILSATTIIQMPFLSKEVTVENTIPLSIELIQGTIPTQYLNYNLK